MPTSTLAASVERWRLPTHHLGEVFVFARLASTNATALDLAEDLSRGGTIILARAQSAGRGQHGRTWQAPPGSSVLMSVLLFPPPALCRPALLTAWAAVSVVELIREVTELEATIKWPNDIYLRGKKVCGILIEQRKSAAGAPATVVGIGLNVLQPAQFFMDAGLALGGSLLTQSGRTLEPDEMARRLVCRLDAGYVRLHAGELGPLETAWRSGLGLLGRTVAVESHHASYRGRLVDLSFDGVTIATAGGMERIAPEAIRRLQPGV